MLPGLLSDAKRLQQYVAPEVVFSSPIETRIERIRKFFSLPKWVNQSQPAQPRPQQGTQQRKGIVVRPVCITNFNVPSKLSLTLVSKTRQTSDIGMPIHLDPHPKEFERREQLIAQRDIAILSRPLGTVSSLKIRLLTWMETPVDKSATLAQMRIAFPNEIPSSISSRVSELVKQGCLTVSHGVYSLKETY